MWRSEMKTYVLVVLSFTFLVVPELFLASPEHGYELSEGESILKFDLMHIDHPASPLYRSHRTVAERFRDSMMRSRNWVQSPSLAESNVNGSLTFSSPIHYSPAGIFLMELNVGSPPQKFTAIMDTGSDITWIQCSPCSGCYQQADPLFDPKKSKTYGTVSCQDHICSLLRRPSCSNDSSVPICQYSVRYGDESTTDGTLSKDAVTLTSVSGRTKAFDFFFGCGHDNHGTYDTTDGIVGFGRGTLSIVSQVGSNFAYMFSYCLASSEKSSPLILGKGLVHENLSWTPLVVNKLKGSYYFLNLTGVSVNGSLLDIPANTFAVDEQGGGGLIIDSGTTVSMLVPAAYNPLVQKMKAVVPYPLTDPNQYQLDLCYDVRNFSNPEFPTAIFHFDGGADLYLPAANLWVLTDDKNPTVCFAVLSSSYGFSIMGNFQQQNVHVAYDLANNRFGFQSNVDCSAV